MGDWSNAALQTVFWNCANAMRREAKLCDIVLYVQNRHGMMVGYPAHKLLLISTSKYFKLLFEREDLRNSCHFPHLNEDGLICVLDIIYGRDISKGVNLDDALMAARFLQVELAVEALEKKMAEDSFSKDKHLSDVKPATLSKPQSRTNNQQQPANVAEVRLFKNLKVTAAAVEDTKQCVKRRKVGTTPESDSFSDSQLTPDTETNQSQGDIITIKMEPDLNLTADDTGSYQGYDHPLSQMSFTQGGEEMADDGEMQNYGMASTDDIDEQDMSFSNQMTNQGFVADTNSTGSVPGLSEMKMEFKPKTSTRCVSLKTFKSWDFADDFDYEEETGRVVKVFCKICTSNVSQIMERVKKLRIHGAIPEGIINYVNGVTHIRKNNIQRHIKPGSLHHWAKHCLAASAYNDQAAPTTLT